MPNQLTRTEIMRKQEKGFAGDLGGQPMPQVVDTALHRPMLRGEAREHYERRISSELHHIGYDQTFSDLFARRYTPVNMQIRTTHLDSFRTHLTDDPPAMDAEEERLLHGKSWTEQKKIKNERKQQQEGAYKTAQENVTSAFVENDAILTSWAKKNVLDKNVKVPNPDGSEEEITQEALFRRALDGDCTNLEQLDPVLRNMAARKYIEGLGDAGDASSPEQLVNTVFRKQGISGLMNPLFRIGVSVLMNGGQVQQGMFMGKSKDFCKQVEDLCNQRIMSATMYTAPDMTKVTRGEAAQNRMSQLFMMKTMLMAHIGGLKKVTDGVREPWDQGMASAFAHCSRVSFTLPAAPDGGGYKLEPTMQGFKSRTAATHRLRRKRKKPDSELEEKKMRLGWYWNQYGMNVGVGGLGNDGVPGAGGQPRQIKNDGSGGHIYLHVDEGDQDSYTGLLVGFESDAPGVMNQTGHKHGTGNPEFMSSFGGLRSDEIGDKYGGRDVDCSRFDGAKFQTLMSTFEAKIRGLQDFADRTGNNPLGTEEERAHAQAELMNICDLLAGKQLSMDKIYEIAGARLD